MTPIKTSLPAPSTKGILARLKKANAAFPRDYPGDPVARQPVHTVYGGAQLFKADSAARLGEIALHTLREYAPGPRVFADVLGLGPLAVTVHARVVKKLET